MKQNKKSDTNQTETSNTDELPDVESLKKKWGVSEEEIKEAVSHVGTDRSSIEEFLVNKKWQGRRDNNEPSFQKRDLNEDETY